MATTTHTPIEHYLRTSYQPDREYVDGEIIERNLGTWNHGRTSGLFAYWLGIHEAEWGTLTALNWRARISPTRVRIPDITVVLASPQPPVLAEAPLLVIEIMSPDDTYSATERKAQDYTNFGVHTIWIIDPETRTGRICTGATWTAATRLEVPGTPIFVDLPTLFAALNPAEK